MATKKEILNNLYKKYGLEKEDTFKHQHYTILTRSGIEKIQRGCNIQVTFEDKVLKEEFAVIKATGRMGDVVIETFGSAKRGKVPTTKGDGNTSTWYVAEMAEKRALSRCVLKISGLYEHNHMGFDESEDFRPPTRGQQISAEIDRLCTELKDNSCTLDRAKEIMADMQEREFENPNSPWLAVIDVAMNVFGDLSHQPLTEDQLTTLEEENSNQPEDEL
jgi:hypothetical protein